MLLTDDNLAVLRALNTHGDLTMRGIGEAAFPNTVGGYSYSSRDSKQYRRAANAMRRLRRGGLVKTRAGGVTLYYLTEDGKRVIGTNEGGPAPSAPTKQDIESAGVSIAVVAQYAGMSRQRASDFINRRAGRREPTREEIKALWLGLKTAAYDGGNVS